jgi:hypothetical protein
MCRAAPLLFHPDKTLKPSSEEVMFRLLAKPFGYAALALWQLNSGWNDSSHCAHYTT